MSVVSVVISNVCTAHASDSFITQRQTDGAYHVKESQRSKLLRVPHWRGALAYWGLALCQKSRWSTLEWLGLRAQIASASSSPAVFAEDLAVSLSKELQNLTLPRQGCGIGIHFTAYELIDGYWVPELFLISNWADLSYSSLRPEGMSVSRETFHAISGEPPKVCHGDPSYRLRVRTFLKEGKILAYNNGDTLLYNSAASGLFSMFQQIAARKLLADRQNVKMWAALARRPVEIVSKAQSDFCAADRRVVGGKPHDLAITPDGQYLSTTGD